MKRTLPRIILPVLVVIATLNVWGLAQTQSPPPLTNASVVKLVKAGFKERTVISIIASRRVNFDLSTDRMIELKRNRVSEKIILAMLARQEGMGMDFDDSLAAGDPFFDEPLDPNRPDLGGTQSPSAGDSADIFGSSGGVRGETRSRGGRESVADDTITTGTATVRIIRPPTEAGSAAAKLEKVKPLTNDSVRELVEAGFSEGTIIRRIEQSPVEFDLTPEKINELRKQRVSERIVNAMRAAMGEETK